MGQARQRAATLPTAGASQAGAARRAWWQNGNCRGKVHKGKIKRSIQGNQGMYNVGEKNKVCVKERWEENTDKVG